MMNDQSNIPVTVVIFGASGDLTRRKLIPSLFNLCRKNRLPDVYHILGFAINDWDIAEFKRSLREGADQYAGFKFTEDEWNEFAGHLSYMAGNFSSLEDFNRLKDQLHDLEKGPSNR